MEYSQAGAAVLTPRQRSDVRTNWSTVLSLLIGTGGITVTGIQPLLLGSLLSRGVLSPSELGIAGAVEIFALAAGIVLGSRLLMTNGSRWTIVAAGLAMALANWKTGSAGADWHVILLRLFAGLSEGVLIAVAMLAISFSHRPERLGGFFLSVSGPPPLILAYLLPSTLNPLLGWNAGFFIMAGIGIICAAAGLGYTCQFRSHQPERRAKIVWNKPIVFALLATLLANAGFGACWTYVEPLANLRGISPLRVGQILTFAIACQISGSFAVALSGRYFRALHFLKIAALLQIGAILLLLTAGEEIQFGVALGALSFFWQASAPCAIALVVALDETRATAPLSFPLSLVGLSIGPLVAATGASSTLSYPYFIGLVMLSLAGILFVIVGRSTRGRLEVRA